MKSSTSKKFAELVTKFPKTVLIFVAGLLVPSPILPSDVMDSSTKSRTRPSISGEMDTPAVEFCSDLRTT